MPQTVLFQGCTLVHGTPLQAPDRPTVFTFTYLLPTQLPCELTLLGLPGSPRQGRTSICLSLKTLEMLLLKPAPENMEVMG